MNENRSVGPNGDGTRDPRSAAEHDVARERKVTPENSVLRETASERADERRPGESESEARARAEQARKQQASAHEEHEEHASKAQRARAEELEAEQAREKHESRAEQARRAEARETRERRAREYQWREGSPESTGTLRDDERRWGRDDDEYRWSHEDDTRWRARESERRAQATSVTTLLRDLAGDAATLTRKEVALARTEISHAISQMKTGVISAATGGGILFAGFLFLLLSATFGLATVMAPWLAALIVGGVVAVIGLILVMSGKQKLQAENFRPDRTADAMKKDQDMLHRRTR